MDAAGGTGAVAGRVRQRPHYRCVAQFGDTIFGGGGGSESSAPRWPLESFWCSVCGLGGRGGGRRRSKERWEVRRRCVTLRGHCPCLGLGFLSLQGSFLKKPKRHTCESALRNLRPRPDANQKAFIEKWPDHAHSIHLPPPHPGSNQFSFLTCIF